MPIDIRIKNKLFLNKNDKQIEKIVKSIIDKRRNETFRLSNGVDFITSNKRNVKYETSEVRKSLVDKRMEENLLHFLEVKKNKTFFNSELKKRRKFVIEKKPVLISMKKNLVNALHQKYTISSFNKIWLVILSTYQILTFLEHWTTLERNRRKKIRKMLTVAYILTLAYKQKSKIKGKNLEERLILHSLE